MPITVYRSGGVYFVRFSLRVKPRRAAFVVGDFTAFMKSIELKFCGNDYCAYIALPPGKYLYRYLVDGEVVLDEGSVERGYNVLILRGSVRRVGPTVARRRLFRAIYGIFVDRFECRGLVGLGIGVVLFNNEYDQTLTVNITLCIGNYVFDYYMVQLSLSSRP